MSEKYRKNYPWNQAGIENSRDGHTILEKVMVQRVFEPLQIISCKVKEKNDHEKV